MKPYYSDVFQFRGSHYDFGYFQGEQLRDSPILPNRERQWRPREKRHFIVNTETSIKFLKEFAPQILDEIRGLADALSLDIKEALKKFGGYYLELTRSGCSIFAGNDFFVRTTTVIPVDMKADIFFISLQTEAMLLWDRLCK
jgi:hypothetical protein